MAIEGGAIAIFLPSLGMGGAERVATTLANAWAGAGQEVHVLTFVKSVNSFQLSPAVRSYDISRGSDVNDIIEILLLAVNLRRYIKHNGIKYFLALGDKYGVLASLALWGTGVRVTVSDRSSPAKHRAWWFRMLKRYAYRRADAVIAQTGASAQALGRYIDFDKIFVVPNPILAPPSMNSERREKIVLNVGRLVPEKGHVHLLRAFAAIPKSEWILVIVGDGPLRSRLQVVGRELGIEDRVVWIGQCDDVSFWYGRASIFVLSSLSEGFPNALGEAMAAGLPCIAFDCVAGPSDLIHSEVNGVLVPPGDEVALRRELMRLMDSMHLRIELGEQAKRRMLALEPMAICEEYFRVCAGLA